MNDYRKLIVWQRSIDFVTSVYAAVAKLPTHERYGLSDQLRRASVSISSNIAEGAKRGSKREFVQFLQIAAGSLAEVETQLILVNKLYTVDVASLCEEVTHLEKMLYTLIKKLKSES